MVFVKKQSTFVTSSLLLGLLLITIRPASAATVFFDYLGVAPFQYSAFGSFSIDDTLFDGSSSQAIAVSNFSNFSFSATNDFLSQTQTWDIGDLIPASTISFDSSGIPDVVGSSGGVAAQNGGGFDLYFSGSGGALAVSAAGFFFDINSLEGDWQIRQSDTPPAVPVPAAVWLFGTALVGLIGFSKRRKAS